MELWGEGHPKLTEIGEGLKFDMFQERQSQVGVSSSTDVVARDNPKTLERIHLRDFCGMSASPEQL